MELCVSHPASVMTANTGFPTRQILRLLDLSEGRLRHWVRSGFVEPARGPGNRFRFRFQDLLILRTAQALVDAGVPVRRVRRALDRLRNSLPEGRSLTGMRILAGRGEVVVEEAGRAWEPASGQWLLDLEVRKMAEAAAPAAIEVAREASAADELTAEEWYEFGLDLEATALDEAIRAYERAIKLRPEFAAPYLNLGRLHHERGALEVAEGLYRQALAAGAGDATAAFNLGVVLQDLGRAPDAAEAYRQAIELDPAYADAYYNLAEVYEQLGDNAVALQNLQVYRRLTKPARS